MQCRSYNTIIKNGLNHKLTPTLIDFGAFSLLYQFYVNMAISNILVHRKISSIFLGQNAKSAREANAQKRDLVVWP